MRQADIAYIVSNNLEWADIMQQRIPAYMAELESQGISTRRARSQANALAVRIRDEWIDLFLRNEDLFVASVRLHQHIPDLPDDPFRHYEVPMFTFLSIVDFFNNYAGIEYAARLNPFGTLPWNSTNTKAAYDIAVTNGDIIDAAPYHVVSTYIDGFGYYRLNVTQANEIIREVHRRNIWHSRPVLAIGK
jgi:hypothetical protein